MLLDILREHVEEAEFLWARRQDERLSPRFDLRRLAELEERLDAHLDGLAAGVEENWPGLDEALIGGEPEARAAAAAAITMAGNGAGLIARLTQLDPSAIVAVTDALCYVDLAPATASALHELLAKAGAGNRAAPAVRLALASVAIEVLSFHRALDATELKPFVRTTSPAVLIAVLNAIARVGGDAALAVDACRHESAAVRDRALSAMVRTGAPGARQACRDAVADPALLTQAACALLGVLGEPGDARLLMEACSVKEAGEAAVAAIASLGAISGVTALLDLMNNARLACAAGAAYTRITGLVAPALAESVPTSEVEDATFDELRPQPDPKGARAQWAAHQARFDHTSRWRQGQRLDPKAWRLDANHGDLLTRREELLRLWSTEPALHPGLELDAPARRQLKVTKGGGR